jgi:hypothetical protein
MPTNYEPFDGDYIDDDYSKFFNDMQAEANFDFGEYPEICTFLEADNTIRVLGATIDQDEWEWDRSFTIPQGWDIERVKKMFEGCVYLEPSQRLTQHETDSGDSLAESELSNDEMDDTFDII